MSVPINIWCAGSSLARQVRQLARALPPVRLDGERLAPAVMAEYLRRLDAGFRDLAAMLRQALSPRRSARGYAVIDGLLAPDAPADENLRLATAVGALAGTPFRVVDKWDLWQDVGVDLNAVPYRFGGIGDNPFHIDVVNATKPPDLFCLMCVRCDPAGGGHTILSNLQDAVAQLRPFEIEQLEQPVFREGRFFGMSGVGEELNPFPVLEPLPGDLWRVRFTAKMLPDMTDSPLKRILQRFERILNSARECFLLKPGQLVMVNQLLVAHGRLALGPDQDRILAARRRYLRQTYIRVER